jgi:hypothetical protein
VFDGSAWNTFNPQSGNAIINGAFEINQRNFTSQTAVQVYTFDRWTSVFGGGTPVWSSQAFTPGAAPVAGYEAANYLRIATTGQTVSSNSTRVEQLIEGVRTFAGQTLTFSFFARAASGTPNVGVGIRQNFGSGGSSSVDVAGQKVAINTDWSRYFFTFNIPSISGKTIGPNNTLTTTIWTSAGSDLDFRSGSVGLQNATIDIWGVQVEAGPVATPFKRNANSLQGELAACERYFQLVDGASFQGGSESLVIGSLNFRTVMRATPSLALTAPMTITDAAADFTQSSANIGYIAGRGSSTGAQISADNFTGLTGFRPYVSTVLWGKIQVSAEL